MRQKLAPFSFMLFMSLVLASSLAAQKLISPAEAKAALAANPNIVLLDVRTKEEYESGSIKDALLLPYDEINKTSAATLIPKLNSEIIVFCRSGRRGALAASSLKKLGYTNIRDLGGILSWPYDLVKPKIQKK